MIEPTIGPLRGEDIWRADGQRKGLGAKHWDRIAENLNALIRPLVEKWGHEVAEALRRTHELDTQILRDAIPALERVRLEARLEEAEPWHSWLRGEIPHADGELICCDRIKTIKAALAGADARDPLWGRFNCKEHGRENCELCGADALKPQDSQAAPKTP